MFKWGSTQLKVVVGSYSAPFPSITITETDLIPSGTESPASTLQSGGRMRKRVPMRIVLNTMSEYQALYLDHLNSAIKNLELKDDVLVPTAMIFEISPPEDTGVWFECDIQFIEV